MVRLIIILCLCIPATGSAETEACDRALAPTFARLTTALNRILIFEKMPGLSSKSRALDQDILAWAKTKISKLSLGQSENVLEVLERWRPEAPGPYRHGRGGIAIFPHGLELWLNQLEAGTEFYRYILVHELAHLFRLVGHGSPAQTSVRAQKILDRPSGVLREELHAFRESYRYLKRNYDASDVDRLHRIHAELPALRFQAVLDGFLSEEINGLMNMNSIKDRAQAELFARIQEAWSSERLAIALQLSLDLDEARNIKKHAQLYRGDQRLRNRKNCIRRIIKGLRGLYAPRSTGP